MEENKEIEPVVKKHLYRPGRSKITDIIPREKIIKAYKVFGSGQKAADALRINVKTLYKVLKESGIDKDIRAKEFQTHHKKYSQFAIWLRDNHDKKLPRSIKKISIITGCSYDSIRCYLYRRRLDVRKQIKMLPDIRKVPALYIDILGEQFTNEDIKEYKFNVNVYSLDVSFDAELKNGTLRKVYIEDLKFFVENVLKYKKLSISI